MKTVSLIVPAKNEEKIIGFLIKSIIKQGHKPLEMIVVDNNSTDSTKSIIKSYVKECAKAGFDLIYMFCEYGNQIEARDMGTKAAKGEIIATCDADCVVPADWINTISKAFTMDVVAIGGPVYFTNWSWWQNLIYPTLFLKIFYIPGIKNRFFFWANNGAFLKAAYMNVNGYKGNRQMINDLKLLDPYDDLFLSLKLKTIGKVVQIPHLRLKCIARDIYHPDRPQNRLFMQLKDYFKIKKYVENHFYTNKH